MRSSVKRRPVAPDLLIVLAVLLLALLVSVGFYGGSETAATVSVTVEGVETERFPLLRAGDVRTLKNRGYTLTLETAEKGGRLGVCVTDADCPNRDCVRSGVITKGGESIVCLPARIAIRLLSDGGADAVLG